MLLTGGNEKVLRLFDINQLDSTSFFIYVLVTMKKKKLHQSRKSFKDTRAPSARLRRSIAR